MEHFGLSLEKEKSRLIESGRFAEKNRKQRGEGKSETFNFLGFTLYCSQSRNGRFRVKRKTSRKKYQKKLKELNAEICEMAVITGMRVQDIIRKLNQILTGYFHYYGITDNIKMLDNFLFRVRRSLFKWL